MKTVAAPHEEKPFDGGPCIFRPARPWSNESVVTMIKPPRPMSGYTAGYHFDTAVFTAPSSCMSVRDVQPRCPGFVAPSFPISLQRLDNGSVIIRHPEHYSRLSSFVSNLPGLRARSLFQASLKSVTTRCNAHRTVWSFLYPTCYFVPSTRDNGNAAQSLAFLRSRCSCL